MSAAPVTEAHRAITESVCELLDSEEMIGPSPVERAAQLIADSEAKAVGPHAHVAAQLAAVLTECGAPEFANSEHALQWAKGIAQLRAELALLREWQREVIQNANAHHAERKEAIARAESAEREVERLRSETGRVGRNGAEECIRAERAEAELNASRYETVKAAQDGLRECIRAERAEAELATERARLDWLMAGGVCMVQHAGGFHVSRLHAPVSRAHIDAAMKEEAK